MLDATALRKLLDETIDIISVIGTDGKQKWMSRAFHRMLGYSEVPVTFPAPFVHPDDQDAVEQAFDGLITPGAPEASVMYRARHADGSWRWMEATARNRIDDPDIAGVVTITRDVSERKAYEEKLLHLASHDWLTGLPNRSELERTLDEALERLGRCPAAVTVFFIDADGFKAVNDTLGHTAGDQALQVIAQRLRQSLRPGDFVARYGGDEFVVVIVDRPDDDGRRSSAVAERIRAAVSAPMSVEGETVSLSVSVGWSVATDPGERSSELIRQADRAAYDEKRSRPAARTSGVCPKCGTPTLVV